MKQNTMPEKTSLTLVPAPDKPLLTRRETFVTAEGNECVSVQILDGECSFQIDAYRYAMDPTLLERMAAGGIIRTPHAELPHFYASGRLRMVWVYRCGIMGHCLVEFLPDADVSHDMGFNDWLKLRYPICVSFGEAQLNEDWRILLHSMWAEETTPPRILTPGDDLLMDAVSFNMDGLVEAILCLQPKIVADPESQRTDYENALLLAIGNAWEFSEEAEAQAANRATSLPEINHGPLSVHGWKHRAERIVSMLKAVGAVDYRPLLAACRVGDLSEVERLLECGFPPNYGLYMQTTPLLEAVRGGHADVCACLLRHGANPDLKWPDDGTPVFKEMEHPLQLAIDQPEIFKLLIEGGVDPTTCGEDGKPLIFRGNYASRVHAETIFGLVEFGSLRGKDQRTGVHDLDARDLALCWDFVPQDLLEKNDLSAMTPLLDAIRRADSSKALFLLDHGADPLTTSVAWSHQVLDIPPPHFRRSESLRHLEHWAMGRIETMTDGEPANADELPTMILTPIQVALLSQNIEVVEKLLELGAKADPKVIALYPFRETARQAKADIIARLTEEPELPAKIKVECSEAPEHAIVWVELACRVINVLLHEPDKAARYPEMVEELDLLRWAESECPDPALVEHFRIGRK
jgi:ankyrin repeat protein